MRLIDAFPLMQNGWHLVKTGKSNEFLSSMSLADVPQVDAVEVVHGRLGVSYMDEYYGELANCLECGTDNVLPCNYCRNCGAKMNLEGE